MKRLGSVTPEGTQLLANMAAALDLPVQRNEVPANSRLVQTLNVEIPDHKEADAIRYLEKNQGQGPREYRMAIVEALAIVKNP